MTIQAKKGRPKELNSLALYSFHIHPYQLSYLKYKNKHEGVGIAQQIRQGIDMYIKESEEATKQAKNSEKPLGQYKTLTLEEALECNKISAEDWLRGVRPANFRK